VLDHPSIQLHLTIHQYLTFISFSFHFIPLDLIGLDFSMKVLTLLITTLLTVTRVNGQASASSNNNPKPTVATQQGTVEGIIVSPAVHAYLGVPYAQPPIGENAYRYAQYPPSSYASSSTPYNATVSKAQCSGISGGVLVGSDDCLYLDIWKPSSATANGSLPVYVFIPYVASFFRIHVILDTG
jgi:hypothetical protein